MRRLAVLLALALTALACGDPSPHGDGDDGEMRASATVAVIAAAPVLRDCNGRPDDGAETRLGTDEHCGSCDRVCAASERCVGEVCLSNADVAMSETHTCVLGGDGRVRCLGANEVGEIGDRTTLLRDHPTLVEGIDDAVELAVRERETCVRRRSGAVACWGEAFGTGRPGKIQLEPTEVAALRGATDLALSDGVLCGLVPEKGIVCLPFVPHDAAVPVAGAPARGAVTDAVNLAALGSTLCAARRDGTVTCWNLRPFDDVPVAERSWSVEGVRGALGLVAGHETFCALRGGNLATCWGGGIVTARGGIRDAIVGGAHDFGALGAVTDLAFLGWPSDDDCATRVDGATVCWPQPFIEISKAGEPREVAARTMELPPATHVESTKRSGSHCALTKAGELYCWGEPTLGRLGVGRDPEQLSPKVIAAVRGVRELVASDHRACARVAAGKLWCWGGGHEPAEAHVDGLDRLLSGRCASVRHALVCHGDLLSEALPDSGLRDVVQLAPANQGTHVLSYFALHRDGTVSRVEWRRDGAAWALVNAARVAGLAEVKELLTVDGFTCAQNGKAALRCWKSLGDPRFDDAEHVVVREVKGKLPEGLASVRLSRVMDDGRSEGCGMKAGQLVCWDLFHEAKPVALAGVRHFDVSPSGMRCALVSGGELKCWDGRYTGHGKSAGEASPTTVPGLENVQGFAFAQRSWNQQDAVFAWTSDGRLFAWGNNGGGGDAKDAGVLGWVAPGRIDAPTKVPMP